MFLSSISAIETRLYEERPPVKLRSLVRVNLLSRLGGLERRSCLYGLLGGRTRRNWMFARGRKSQRAVRPPDEKRRLVERRVDCC